MARHSNKDINGPKRQESADLSHIKYELERFFIGGAFDLCEEERFVATLEPECCVVEISYGKLVLSCWHEDWSRAWRVVGCQALDKSLRLYCTTQMGSAHCVLTLRRGQAKGEVAESRAGFFTKITTLIEANLAGFQVEQAILARDDRRHFSGIYTRLILNARGNAIAAVAVGEGEAQDYIDASLGEALIWLEELRGRGRTVNRLALFVPAGKASTIASRLTFVKVEGAKISLYEVNQALKEIKPVAAFDQAD
jgi:hypothetical protein